MTRYLVKEYGALHEHDDGTFEYGLDFVDTWQKNGWLLTVQFTTDKNYTGAEIQAEINTGEFWAKYFDEWAILVNPLFGAEYKKATGRNFIGVKND